MKPLARRASLNPSPPWKSPACSKHKCHNEPSRRPLPRLCKWLRKRERKYSATRSQIKPGVSRTWPQDLEHHGTAVQQPCLKVIGHKVGTSTSLPLRVPLERTCGVYHWRVLASMHRTCACVKPKLSTYMRSSLHVGSSCAHRLLADAPPTGTSLNQQSEHHWHKQSGLKGKHSHWFNVIHTALALFGGKRTYRACYRQWRQGCT